jgi:hypothetical protein
MKLKNIVASVVVMFSSSLAMAAESTIPADSMGSLGVFVAHEKFRIYSESCAEAAPGSKATYDFIASAFTARLQRLGAEVLATDDFKAMTAQSVPPSLVEAVRADLDATKRLHMSKTLDASRGCNAAHENFIAADDNHWKAGIASLLTELRATGRPPAAAPVANAL